MTALSQPRAAADLGALYRLLAPRLDRAVRRDVRASDPVIEDACQFAWSRFVCHADRVRRDAALAWLTKTAIHEVFKLNRRTLRDLSLDAKLEANVEGGLAGGGPPPEDIVEQRSRLAAIAQLPARQQRLIWLQGLGLSYAEMAVQTGSSTRTVERQLLRARQRLRGICAE